MPGTLGWVSGRATGLQNVPLQQFLTILLLGSAAVRQRQLGFPGCRPMNLVIAELLFTFHQLLEIPWPFPGH